MRAYPKLVRTARTAFALLLAFAVPVNAETTTDPLWYLFSTYVVAPDARAVQAGGDGSVDSKKLAGLQADLTLLAEGFESFRDDGQVRESLAKLEPQIAPELKPFFKDRASSLDAIYRTLAVVDYTWALRFPEPPCAPVQARRQLLDGRDGLFQDKSGQASAWLVSLLGSDAVGKSAAQALDQASSKTKLTPAEYERRRALIRKLSLALESDKAVGAARSKLYCSRASAFEELASFHRDRGEVAVLASRSVAQAAPEQSVFILVSGSHRSAATLLKTKFGPVLLADASAVQGDEHPRIYAYSSGAKPIDATATVARRDSRLGLATLTYSEDLVRPALMLAATPAAHHDLVNALGHTMVSGPWTKTSGLVTKTDLGGFQTDAAVSTDFTGGPVLNDGGEVVGLLVSRPADTEEGRWPVAVSATTIALWLEGAAVAAAPTSESIADDGTAALISRARPDNPSGLTVASIPDPPAGNIVCMKYCESYSSPSRSYSLGGSSYDQGSAELGQAIGKLGAVLILKGIPALFRGIGKLFKGSGESSVTVNGMTRATTAKVSPPPKKEEPPLPPDPVLSVSVTTARTSDAVIFTARVTGNRNDLKLDGINIDFTINETESATATTDSTGIAVLTVKNPHSQRALNKLDEESAKHPWLTNASSHVTKQGACEVTLIGATIAVATYVAVRAPIVVMTAGGLALKAPKPAVVKACLGIAGATTAAAAAACTSMLGEDSSKRTLPAPKSDGKEVVPTPGMKTDSVPPARKGDDLVKAKSDSAHDDLKKAEQDNAGEEGSIPPKDMTGPADPGAEPPEEEPQKSGDSSNSLNEAQQKKLADFQKNLPKSADRVTVRDLPNGGKALQADVPARNIPGSFARYEKQIDAMGNTTSFTKTTFGPDGRIIHVRVTEGLEKKLFWPEP